jgi:uncharacterized protein YeaO (DUF488 family)
MSVRVVRLGSARRAGEGPRIGAVRRPPRGVPKRDYARRDFYDAWLPELSPSQKWVTWASSRPWTEARWKRLAANYRREMRAPAARHVLDVLAALSQRTNLSIGCYCRDEQRCHRSLLRKLLREHGAKLAP